MLYIICKAKNETALNEQDPKFNSENWEVVAKAKCRKNASTKTWESVFYPIYQELNKLYASERFRLWNFPIDELL